MKWRLKVVEDMSKVKSLVFCSFADAKRFLDFINVYMDETGCGNGYSAYWPNRIYILGSRFLPFTEGVIIDSKPMPYLFTINPEKNVIWANIFQQMLYAVLQIRFVGEKNIGSKVSEVITLHGVDYTTKGIKFTFDVNDLPPCQRPTVGDMYRIPRNRLGNDPNILEYSEGRVVEDHDKTLKVISCFDESHKKANPRIFEIDAIRAIKINDWLKAMRR